MCLILGGKKAIAIVGSHLASNSSFSFEVFLQGKQAEEAICR